MASDILTPINRGPLMTGDGCMAAMDAVGRTPPVRHHRGGLDIATRCDNAAPVVASSGFVPLTISVNGRQPYSNAQNKISFCVLTLNQDGVISQCHHDNRPSGTVNLSKENKQYEPSPSSFILASP